MDSLDNLERDVNACLTFLLANQDKWDVEAPTGAGDKWAHLDDETREQYEAIEARVRDKVARGEL